MSSVSNQRRQRADWREQQAKKKHRLREGHERCRGEIGDRPDEADATEGPRDERRTGERRDGRDNEPGKDRPPPALDMVRHRTPNECPAADERRHADDTELVPDLEDSPWRRKGRGGADRQQGPRRRRPLQKTRRTQRGQHRRRAYRCFRRADQGDIHGDGDDRRDRRCAPRQMKKLEQDLERHGDDSDVQPRDREHVREPCCRITISDLGREIARVGDEQRPRERGIGWKDAIDRLRCASTPAPPPIGPGDDDNIRMVNDVAALSRPELTMHDDGTPRRCVARLHRQRERHWALDSASMHECAWRRLLLDDRAMHPGPNDLALAPRVADSGTRGDQRARRERRAAGADDRVPMQRRGECDGDAAHAGERGAKPEAAQQAGAVRENSDGNERHCSLRGVVRPRSRLPVRARPVSACSP